MNLVNSTVKGRIVTGAEPSEPEKIVRHDEPQDIIDICLSCERKNCTGHCSRFPDATGTSRKIKRAAVRAEKERIEDDKMKSARLVADIYRNGATESFIARQLGMTVGEVKDFIKYARKKELLY